KYSTIYDDVCTELRNRVEDQRLHIQQLIEKVRKDGHLEGDASSSIFGDLVNSLDIFKHVSCLDVLDKGYTQLYQEQIRLLESIIAEKQQIASECLKSSLFSS